MTSKKSLLTDLLISLLLISATVYYAARYVDFTIPPFEDAAMLMRYSQHLAQGHGIVWNIGEHPVDGATDFLFMATAALFIKLGLTVGQAVRGIGFTSHIFTVLIVYWTNRRVHNANLFLSLFSGLYLALGTGLAYVAAYFGTPYFALAAASTWTLGLILIKWHRRERTLREAEVVVEARPERSGITVEARPERSGSAVEARPERSASAVEGPPFWLTLAFALSGLITGLIRPEGVILASLMLLAVVVMRGWKNSISIILTFAIIFLVLGGSYFAWRWNYFGYPLPNPFYKKGDGGLHWDAYYASLWNALRLCLPFAILALLGFRSRETTIKTLAYLIPILGFAAAFVLISDEMNYGARFQYAILPLALMSWIPLLGNLDLSWLNQFPVKERSVYVITGIALMASLLYYSWYQNCLLTPTQLSCTSPYERDGRYEMAKILAQYRDKGYVIATTEAGLLPYYSGWTAIDTWGLNDQFIAHNGKITVEYLDKYKPEVIMFHDYYSPLVPPKLTEANLAQRWFGMTILMKTYAEEHGYVLAAIFGDSPYDTHYYYVRSDFADSEKLIDQISKMKSYYWPVTGKRAINYAPYETP